MINPELGAKISHLFRVKKYSTEDPKKSYADAREAASTIDLTFKNTGAQLPRKALLMVFSATSPNQASLILREAVSSTHISQAIKFGRIK